MLRSRLIRVPRTIALAGAVLVIGACDSTPTIPSAPTNLGVPSAARATSGPSVTETSPSYGHRGETNKPVTITGSGFSAGSTVEWARNGVTDPNISVVSATVVSSTQINAVINIGDNAELSLYDVVVTTADRKKGVGTELFEITTATSIGSLGGTTLLRATNDNTSGPRAVGYSMTGSTQHAIYWPNASGGIGDLGTGDAEGIDQLGTTVLGKTAGYAVVWTASSGWAITRLPVAASAPGSRAEWLTSGSDGAALYVGGSEHVSYKGGFVERPRVWKYNSVSGGWEKIVLQMHRSEASATAWVKGVTASGEAAGAGNIGNATTNQVVFWATDGSASILPGPLGSTATGGINSTGTIIAGSANGVAAYWSRNAATGTWSGPFTLPGGCTRATGVDDNNRIIGNDCANVANRTLSAVWVPPYDAASMTTLHGLGDKADAGQAWAISPRGTLIGGGVKSGKVQVGVIWAGGY